MQHSIRNADSNTCIEVAPAYLGAANGQRHPVPALGGSAGGMTLFRVASSGIPNGLNSARHGVKEYEASWERASLPETLSAVFATDGVFEEVRSLVER